MFDYLATLSSDRWILDLGSSSGSFDQSITRAKVVRVDLESKPTARGGSFVRAEAARLPLRDHCIDVVIANHCMEHIVDLDSALREIGRVVKPLGALFASVPDASTLTDKIYRWLARGGGHVNPFTSRDHLPTRITAATNLPLKASVDLYSGLSFLNRKNLTHIQRKLWLLGGGYEPVLRTATFALRQTDRALHTRLSHYGWGYYFGGYDPGILHARSNVCIGCGSGSSARSLRERGIRHLYTCPECGSRNFFTDDES